MHSRRRGFYGGFRFGLPPFLFHYGFRPFPRRGEYLRMLEEYKDKILWGTDFPNIPYDYDRAKDSLLRFNLSKAFYNKVFFENAKKLYQL